MRRFWLEDPAHRVFAVAVVCSVLLHILLLASLAFRFNVPVHAKRGEPLIVDIVPEKPEEKAPLGVPAQPPGPPPPKVAEAPAPKAKLPPAPPARPPAVAKAAPPPPEPPKQVAKAAPPEPEARARETAPPQPSPPPVPAPQPSPQPQEAQPVPAPSAAEATRSQPAPPPSTPSEGAAGRTALAKPPAEAPSIFRSPGGGGGLHGGRGGSMGEPIPLDTPDPNYREYMEKVRKRIYANWGYPYEAQQQGLQGKLVIEFHIAKDGHLQFIDLRQTSGQDILDSFAMTAVKLAQLYPPLPDAMNRDVLPVVGVFIYTLKGPLSVLQSLH